MNQTKLINPSFLELDDAYRGLPQYGSLLVSTNQPGSTLRDMEQIGFVALGLVSDSQKTNQITISAYKGKHGPCHFHGATANYTGQALAALDDDLHLLIKDKPILVCEKTKRVLALPPYQSTVVFQSKGEALPSNTNDFEDGISVLLELLKSAGERSDDRKSIFYPGPFRLLILPDGSIVRRGMCNNIPSDLAENFIKKEGCSVCDDGAHAKQEYFQDSYASHGSRFMLSALPVVSLEKNQTVKAEFSQLKSIVEALRKRLLNAIAKQQKYFILVGSDMDDESGCCPSQEVTDANRLVRHGILSSLHESMPGDSCPVTIFAFRNELETNSSGFTSNINVPFRKEVEGHLKKRPGVWKPLVRWTLLAFVCISLLLAVKQCRELNAIEADGNMVVSLLNPTGQKQLQLILFHNQKRCFQCLEMERQTKELVEEYFSKEVAKRELVLKSIAMDEPQFIGLAERYQLFAATLVLVDFDGKSIIHEKALLQTGSFYRDEPAFKAQLKMDIEALLHHD